MELDTVGSDVGLFESTENSNIQILSLRLRAVEKKEAELCQLRADRLGMLEDLYVCSHPDDLEHMALPSFKEKMARVYEGIDSLEFPLDVNLDEFHSADEGDATAEGADGVDMMDTTEEHSMDKEHSTTVIRDETVYVDAQGEAATDLSDKADGNKTSEDSIAQASENEERTDSIAEKDVAGQGEESSLEDSVALPIDEPLAVPVPTSEQKDEMLSKSPVAEATEDKISAEDTPSSLEPNPLSLPAEKKSTEAEEPVNSSEASINVSEEAPSKRDFAQLVTSTPVESSGATGAVTKVEVEDPAEPALKKRRILPPIERMVTRGVTAKLTRSPETKRMSKLDPYAFGGAQSSPGRISRVFSDGKDIRRARRHTDSPFEKNPEIE
ncbi:hypothetical protein HDU67_002887, partial [Dinochytrium kinnereticum]